MTLSEIYAAYVPGSDGFCKAVDTHCGFCTSFDETKRIAERATSAEDFQKIWENEDRWTDIAVTNADEKDKNLAAG